MNKLQRYYIPTSLADHASIATIGGDWCRSTDVSALEAENERLREVLKNLLQDTQHSNHHCKDTIENCPVLAAKAVLHREQEKQP